MKKTKKLSPANRIWELDAFRGLCLLGMVVVHLIYDLTVLYRIIDWQYPAWFDFIQHWGGVLFLVLSGICVTLGSRNIRRGLIVILFGFICTAVTYGMFRFSMADKSIIIWFGVLHCLGCCMVLWFLFKRMPTWLLAVFSGLLIIMGMWLRGQLFTFHWLMPLGFLYRGFASSDYFPLILNLGFFLLGAILGRTLYRNKKTLLPNMNTRNPLIRFLCGCGRQSLLIYLLHQPILAGISMLISMVLR